MIRRPTLITVTKAWPRHGKMTCLLKAAGQIRLGYISGEQSCKSQHVESKDERVRGSNDYPAILGRYEVSIWSVSLLSLAFVITKGC